MNIQANNEQDLLCNAVKEYINRMDMNEMIQILFDHVYSYYDNLADGKEVAEFIDSMK